jgi:hypothetical protein
MFHVHKVSQGYDSGHVYLLNSIIVIIFLLKLDFSWSSATLEAYLLAIRLPVYFKYSSDCQTYGSELMLVNYFQGAKGKTISIH